MTRQASNHWLQPTLQGKRVLVRPLVEMDRELMYAAAADPRIWTQHPAKNRHEKPAFDAFFDQSLNSGGAMTLVERASDAIIGSSRYHDFDPDLSEVEIGWTFLARAFWGGEYNREVKSLMLDHAFTHVGTVVFWVAEDNHRSRKAVERIGGELRTGIVRRSVSGMAPYVVYQMTSTRWSSITAKSS